MLGMIGSFLLGMLVGVVGLVVILLAADAKDEKMKQVKAMAELENDALAKQILDDIDDISTMED